VQVFISHASPDAPTAAGLCAALEAAGVPCWIAPRDVRPGEPYAAAIVNAINAASSLLLILTKSAIDSPHVLREVERASSKRKPVLSIRMDNTELPPELEYFLSVNHWLDGKGVPLASLTPRVVDLLRGQAPITSAGDAPGATGPAPQDGAQRHSRGEPRGTDVVAPPPSRLAKLIAGGVLAVVIGALVVWQWGRSSGPAGVQSPANGAAAAPPGRGAATGDATAALALKPRIAVLPFENLSPDPGNALFTDGVHEEVLTSLANQAAGLEVISRTTMASYKGKAVTMQALAAELHCSYVLEGSVRREGKQVRLSLQLIDARGDTRVWGQDFDRQLVSAMALESEVAAAVAAQLSLRFNGADSLSSADPQAFDLYLKAKAAFPKAVTREENLAVLRLLDNAISLDPGFVRAYLTRMEFRANLFSGNVLTPEEALPEAHRDLAAAQRLAPTSPTVKAYAAVLAYAELDYPKALALFEGAEAEGLADPDLLDWKDALLFALGRYPEAVALARRLADLDPRNEVAQQRWWYMLMEMHQYADALRLADSGIASARDVAGWRESRASVLFYGGGNLEPLRAFFADLEKKPLNSQQEVDENLPDYIEMFFLEHRFQDFRTHLDGIPVATWNCTYIDWPLRRVGLTPVADLRGWNDPLLGDHQAAARESRKILDFLDQNPETRWNRWYREILRADAQLFMGDAAAANRTAAAALALTRAKLDVSDQMNALIMQTRILAWTDAKEAAVKQLAELSTAVPGLWPGEIGGDPLYSIPLAPLASYRELTDRLSAQMRASGIK
jgi:TolB-like protein